MYNEENKIVGKKILILGMARSGYFVTKLLAKDNEIIITDIKEQKEENVKEIEELGAKFIVSSEPENILDESFDILVRNPAVMPSNKAVIKAKELNIPTVNEMEIAYHYLPKNITIIGITGSNGKTTTTTMVYDLLKMMNKDVILGGNIGFPLSQIVEEAHEGSILVLEISDHQMYDFKDFKTNIGVLTNLCPTHLDFHGNYENYKNVKKRIFNHHTKDDLAIINFGNEDSLNLTKDIASTKKFFNGNSAYLRHDAIYINNEFVIALDDILLKGIHNYENIMAALLVVNEFGLDKEIIKKYFGSFKGVEHRLEFVTKKDDIVYYNDSKATNPTSTLIALKSFKENVHLILGGMERKQDFHELDEAIGVCKCIYAIGEVTDKVMEYAKSMNIPCEKCETLNNAMNHIKNNAVKGDTVLLSPASASWDQYLRFEDRGDEFKGLI